MKNSKTPYILGIDVGTSSIGWAAVSLESEKPAGILKMGVRRFEAGVSGDIESGNDASRATERRDKRGPRRQTWRRQFRVRKVFRTLQKYNLLPPSEDDNHDTRHELISALDNTIRAERNTGNDRKENHVLVYSLRAEALDKPIPPFHLGRALFHLAQRRGFLSNRKTATDEKEQGVVKKGISELAEQMAEAGVRTIGEYFSTLDPEETQIRKRWTARGMFINEFNLIWDKQSESNPTLNTEAKQEIFDALFDQRPLKSQKMLIGKCSHEPTKRRAPVACLEYQQFRLVQKLNDLMIIEPSLETRPLTNNERSFLLSALELNPSLTFGRIRTLLGLKKSKEYQRGYSFNYEVGGDKSLIGNKTQAKLAPLLEDTWNDLEEQDQITLVNEIISFESEDALATRLQKGWGFNETQAREVSEIVLEQGYGSISRKAIRTLMPLMSKGVSYATAVKDTYGTQEEEVQVHDLLPPYVEVNKELRNPAVERAVSELRKVINALVREYGKPSKVRVELARDLKNSRVARKNIQKRNKDNQKIRDKARAEILRELGEKYVTPNNILKVRLADECNWECPYTGKPINMESLIKQAQFDIEHIIPFSRCLDNSYMNKTLCYHSENRNVKRNNTPFEAYSSTDKYNSILARVRRFQGEAGRRKLDKFKTEKLPDSSEFNNRQLNDTRYIAKITASYLGLLFGGTIVDHKQTVQVSPGRVTAYLRQRWNLNSILGHSDRKDRADHRHHAIDALVIALTSPDAVSQLNKSAARMDYAGGKLFADIDPPWDSFLEETQKEVRGIIVSSRVSKKLNGGLHKDTIYSFPRTEHTDDGKETKYHTVRKPLVGLTKSEVEQIFDPRIKSLIKARLASVGGTPDKVFKEAENLPQIQTGDGRINTIKKVRIRRSDNPMSIGNGTKKRFVNAGDNHHMEIVAELDDDGNEIKWKGIIVSRFDAISRHSHGEPVIQTNHLPDGIFKFSIRKGEYLMMNDDKDIRTIYRTLSVSERVLEFIEHTDARPSTTRRKIKGARITASVDAVRKRQARKVTVCPLGSVLPSHD